MYTQIEELRKLAQNQATKTVVLANAQDEHALVAIQKASSLGYIEAILVGDENLILGIAKKREIDISMCRIIHIEGVQKAIQKAIDLIQEGEAQILMKGKQRTSELMRAVLQKENALRTDEKLSHFALFQVEGYHKLLALSDVAINVRPDVDTKVSIIRNAVNFMNKIGYKKPKTALISAVEEVSKAIESTVEADEIKQLAEERKYQKAIIDGPLSFDIATSKKVAAYKGYQTEVAGDADLLIFPNIESGNILYKSLVRFTKHELACVVLGAKVPIVLVSRADSEETKLNSILLACL